VPLASVQNWYDFSLRVKNLPGWLRRFAGHLENGLPSISDPALQGPAQLEQAAL
jgi:phospholipase C